MPKLTDHTVIARQAWNEYHDVLWYHVRCAPDGARDFTLAHVPDSLDGDGVPEILRRHCLKCDRAIVTDQAIETAVWDVLERKASQMAIGATALLTDEERRHCAPLNGNREFRLFT